MYPTIEKLIDLLSNGTSSLTNKEVSVLIGELNDYDTLGLIVKLGFVEVSMEYDQAELNALAALRDQGRMWLSGTTGSLAISRGEHCFNEYTAGINSLKKKPKPIIKEGTSFCDLVATQFKTAIDEKREQKKLEAEKQKEKKAEEYQQMLERQREETQDLENYIAAALKERKFDDARKHVSYHNAGKFYYDKITHAEIKYITERNSHAKQESERQNRAIKDEYEKKLDEFNKLSQVQKALDDLFYIQKIPWVSINKRGVKNTISRRTESEKKAYADQHRPTPPTYKEPFLMSTDIDSKTGFKKPKFAPFPKYENFHSSSRLTLFPILDLENFMDYSKKTTYDFDIRTIAFHEEKLESFETIYEIHKEDLISLLNKALDILSENIHLLDQKSDHIWIGEDLVSVSRDVLKNPNSKHYNLEVLKQSLLNRKDQETYEAVLEESKIRNQFEKRNQKRLEQREFEKENIRKLQHEKERILSIFNKQKSYAKTYKFIIKPYNELVAIQFFRKIYLNEARSWAGYMHDLVENNRITEFSFIITYAFKQGFQESKTSRILRCYKEIFHKILFAPFFIRIDTSNITNIQLIPLATFTNTYEAKEYALWFYAFNPKPVKDAEFINKFSLLYLAEAQSQTFFSPFDKMIILIRNKQIMSYKHIQYYANSNPNTLTASLLSKKENPSCLYCEAALLQQTEEKINSVTITSLNYTSVVAKIPKEIYKQSENLERLGVDVLYVFNYENISYIPVIDDEIPTLPLCSYEEESSALLEPDKKLFDMYIEGINEKNEKISSDPDTIVEEKFYNNTF